MAKNAYTFAKRAKELAKKKKKEEKSQRKSERPDAEDGPYFDEATGEIVYPEPKPAADDDAESAEDGEPAEKPAP